MNCCQDEVSHGYIICGIQQLIEQAEETNTPEEATDATNGGHAVIQLDAVTDEKDTEIDRVVCTKTYSSEKGKPNVSPIY